MLGLSRATSRSAADRTATSTLMSFMHGLVEHGGMMIVRSTQTGEFLMVNPAFERFIGRPASEIVGRTVRDVYRTEDAETILARDRQVLSGHIAPQFITLHGGDGTPRSLLAHKFPLFDPDGNLFAVGNIAMDVTEISHQAALSRAAHLESENRFKAVFDNMPIGQIFWAVNGLVVSVNAAMAEMLGYRPEEIVGRSVKDFMPIVELPRVRLATEQMLSNGALRVTSVRRFLHRDGHEVPARSTTALVRDHEGLPRWWVSMVVDTTEEERTRAEIERVHDAALLSADRLRLLHSIATAANESTQLDTLTPRVLSLVCEHFRWRGGAFVRCDGGTGPARAVVHGDATGIDAALRTPELDGVTVLGAGADALIVVPLPGADGAAALVFCAGATDLDSDQREVLSLVALETARVVERQSAARRLRHSETRFRSVFDSSPLPMALSDSGRRTFTAVNNALCELLGRRREELLGRTARDICHRDDVHLVEPAGAAALAAPDGRHRTEIRLMHSSGAVVTTVVTLAWVDGPDGTRQLLAQIEDITTRRNVEEVLRRQAEHDSLTGLANRTSLGRMLCDMGANRTPCAILFIDLDGFKLINDTRGHDVGDEVLVEVAARLRNAVRPSDVVARFGGDEFVVVCPGLPGEELDVAQRVADRIELLLGRPITTQDGPALVSASIGIAGGMIDDTAPQELLQRADAAMYQAKRLGKDRREVYDEHLHARAIEHQRTEAALRTALADGRFVVHYQPIVDLADSSVVGFEALVRLVDEQGRLVGPDQFIGVAEQSGLVVQMGSWVLAESCRTIAWLREQTGRPYTVSVNIAARQAARADLAATVLDAVAAADLPESALTLELTESALLEADGATHAQLVRLQERGVVIGLDDFGTGYSSLTYLRRFPVSHLKVDRSFVSGMDGDPSDLAIVRAVTGLASELGLSWIAEGVETTAQRDLLAALGPGLAQGYLFSRPVPRSDLLHVVSPMRRTA